MKLLKRENWWAWLLLDIGSQGTSIFVLGALLDVYKKNTWYAKWKNWVIPSIAWLAVFVLGILSKVVVMDGNLVNLMSIISTMFLPAMVMYLVFYIQVLCLIAAKLNVPGKELYLSSYVWLICLIMPIIGWILLLVMIIYLEIWPLVMLHSGEGEKYIS